MDFVLFYRDPLFGVIMFVAIIAAIALLDYSRSKYKAKKKRASLQNLAKSYETDELNEDIIEFVKKAQNSIPSLMLIAKSLSQSGKTQMAIQIYLSLLEAIKNESEKIIVLEALGLAYMEAGFLERSKGIFIQILENFPKNPTILTNLMICHESMGEYQSALDVLQCLDELESNNLFAQNKAFLELMILINSPNIPLELKAKRAKKLSFHHIFLQKITLKFLKETDLYSFWEYALQNPNLAHMIDIFWDFKLDDLPKNVSSNPDLYEIFTAKGYLKDGLQNKSNLKIFELEALKLLNKNEDVYADIYFEYRCSSCHSLHPFDSPRCPVCKELGTLDPVLKLAKV
ncbi:MAG: hypothetical protein E7K04_05060 [Helicobacter sp.]|nr:hypothetical protein [Helicobacter sp.]